MPLPWVRLDTAFPYNPKLLAMVAEKDGHRAALVYLCSLGYSGAHGTDGFIPREALTFIHGRLRDADRLVAHGFWWPQPGGWLINDWAGFQESNEETQKRRKRAQAGAAARWEGHEPVSHAERQRRYRERKAAEQNGTDPSDGDDP
jgi:hypothetical protein